MADTFVFFKKDFGTIPLRVIDNLDGTWSFKVATTGGGAGGTSSVDNAAFVAGTTPGTPSMGAVDDVATTVTPENAVGITRITPQRAWHVNLRSNAGVEQGTAGAPLRTDPTGATTQPVSYGSGTFTVAGTVTANAGTGPFPVAGTVAHGSADSGNPVKVGGRARTSDITAVANDQRTDFMADKIGRQVVAVNAIPENEVDGAITSSITNTTSTALIAAQGAGVRTYLGWWVITNGHATVGTYVNLLDGATVRAVAYCSAAGGGAVLTFNPPLVGAANTAWNVQAVTTGADLRSAGGGYKGA